MAAARKGWWTRNTLPWGKRTASLQLSVTPTLTMNGVVGAVSVGLGLSVTPSLEMVAAARHAAQLDLSVTPELTIGLAPIPASVGLTVTPALSMDAVAHVPASLSLAVSPVLGVTAAPRHAVALGLSVTPTLSMTAKATTTYSSFPAVPTGTVDVALTSGAGVARIQSNTLQESNSSSGYQYSAAVLPDAMATDLFSVEATAGALSGGVARAVGPGVFSADGSNGVMAFIPATSSSATIHSRIGGTFTQRASLSGLYATAGQAIKLLPSVSAGLVTWTVYINGVATGLSWVDSGHLVDLPGRHPAAVFKHYGTSGQYFSLGVAALTATDI